MGGTIDSKAEDLPESTLFISGLASRTEFQHILHLKISISRILSRITLILDSVASAFNERYNVFEILSFIYFIYVNMGLKINFLLGTKRLIGICL